MIYVHLKALVQLLAASRARRPAMRYLTFGDAAFAAAFRALVSSLRRARMSVGEVVQSLDEVLERRPPRWEPSRLFDELSAAALAACSSRRPPPQRRAWRPPSPTPSEVVESNGDG